MEQYDILIIGGGAAGIAAAKAARGAKVLLADRRSALGGVLLQCAHRGFGKEQTGMEYAAQLLADFPEEVELALGTTVLEVTAQRRALLHSADKGRCSVSFSQLILATGCREIPIGALNIAGTRPRDIYTAGQMQEMMNLYGFVPKGPVVILGSGDLGLIMARQIAAEGEQVSLVERQDTCGGMAKNQRCLKEYPIDLHCGVTVEAVEGMPDVQAVTLTDGTVLHCRTLLIAAGLRPERELIAPLEGAPWLQLCGNCDYVHPMVEAVVQEGTRAGLQAVEALGKERRS